jgi:S-adenosylmethionine decarboxylase
MIFFFFRYLFTLDKPKSISEADQTLEIIMTKLDPEVMSIFTKEVSSCTEDATEVGLTKKCF